MTQPKSVSLDKPFVSNGVWWAQAHVAQYLLAGQGPTETSARKSLDQEIKALQRQLKERRSNGN